MAKTTACVDWVAATFPYDTKKDAREHVPFHFADDIHEDDWTRGHAIPGYSVCFEHRQAKVKVYVNGTRPEMGIHVVMSGGSLAEMRGMGISDRGVINRVLEYGGRVSRIDIAVDVVDSNIVISDLWNRYKNGHCKTPARNGNYIVSHGSMGGDTMYIGKRSSTRMLRIYDKARQMGDAVSNWKRIELEVKKPVAQQVAKAISTEGVSAIPKLIRNFCDFGTDPAWGAALGTEGILEGMPEVVERKTKEWILSLPLTIFRYVDRSGDVDTLKKVIADLLRVESTVSEYLDNEL